MDASEIAKIIKEKYKELGMTQTAFCDAIGIKRQTLYYWEKNRSCPSPETLERVNAVLGLNFSLSLDKKMPATENGDGLDESAKEALLLFNRVPQNVRDFVLSVMREADKSYSATQDVDSTDK